jgi:soluble lytic murein transglycosylase-like protein
MHQRQVKLLLVFLLSFNCYASDINSLVKASAEKYNVEERLIHSIIKQESNYNINAISKASAAGLMQLMPQTARRFGVDNRFDPKQNIDGGTHYLRVLLDMFNGDTTLAVAGYNAGEGAVQKYNGIPPYRETQDYVKKVIANISVKQSFSKYLLKSNQPLKVKNKIINMAAWNALCNFYTPYKCGGEK